MASRKVDFRKAQSAYIEPVSAVESRNNNNNSKQEKKFLAETGKRQLSCPSQILSAREDDGQCQGKNL